MSMASAGKFGTFGGVFTPSILTILGVIMYLRLPSIVGEAGLFPSLFIIFVAHIISVTTGFSVSSIATDKRVQAGGTYYMISRSLGLPIGGTLGIALFVGLSFSVSLYLIGFSESFLRYWDFGITENSIRLAGTIILLVVTAITFISTSLAIKTQYFIMAAIGLSLLSIFFGRHAYVPDEPLLMNSGSANLMVLFGIFFPAVTGFEAGVSMSGDLRDPKKSIPIGAITAIGAGFIVYVGLAVFFSLTVTPEILKDPTVLLKISLVPQLVIAGIWGATLSSALGSILGAPRILQATALDNITPRIFSRTSGRVQEPRNALILTFFIAEAGILIGDLDVIARIVTIFFIMTYGFLNLSAAFETWTSADFRPEFRTPAWVSAIGATACILVMMKLDLLAMFAAALILGLLFLFLKRQELTLESGDAWSGIWASLIKAGVARLSIQKMHERNWRPNIIMFSGNKIQRSHLVEFGRAMSGRLGMLSSFELIAAKDADRHRLEAILPQEEDDAPSAFSFQYRCSNVYEGMMQVSRLYGFHGIEPNTILMGWSRKEENRSAFAQLLEDYRKGGFSTVLLSYKPDREFGSGKTIDLWWSGTGSNIGFALFSLRHLTSSRFWSAATMRLLVINYDAAKKEQIHRALARLLDDYRIEMGIRIINNGENRIDEHEIIQRESAHADLTIVGIEEEQYRSLNSSIANLNELLSKLGTAAVIHGSSTFEEADVGVVGADQKMDDSREESEAPMSLPDLPVPTDPDLAEDIHKTNVSGSRALTLFYEKAIAPSFKEGISQFDAFSGIAMSACASVEKARAFKDGYRYGRAILKAKNDFLFACRRFFEQAQETLTSVQIEALTEGIHKYANWIEKSYLRFPCRQRVAPPESQYIAKPNDQTRVRLRAQLKRSMYMISGKILPRVIPSRKIARYYLYDNRHAFLAGYLKELEESFIAHLTHIKSLIFSLLDSISALEAKIPCTEEDIQRMEREIVERVNRSKEDLHRCGNDYRHKLQLEFRENLIALVGHLQRAATIRLHFVRRKGKKYYSSLALQNRSFSERFLSVAERNANKALLDVLIAAMRCRVEDRMEDFWLRVIQEVDARITHPLSETIAEIESILKDNSKVEDPDLTCEIDATVDIEEGLEELREQMIELTRTLPEILLAGNETEETEIHVERLVNHFLESRLIAPLQASLASGNESLRTLAFGVKDILNLMRFNLQNIDAEVSDRRKSEKEILSSSLESIRRESESVQSFKKSFHEEMDKLLANAFEPLAPENIEKSSTELSETLREYTGQKVLSTFGHWRDTIAGSMERRIIRLRYSKSQGLIRARKLRTRKIQSAGNSPVLDLLQVVSPDRKVLQKLPPFYINLFSSRSSIGTEFYIERNEDERHLENAIERYKEGYRGGILVLGERNAGKTVFCRHMIAKHFSNGNAHHIFPPKPGSASVEDLTRIVQQATGFSGSLTEIAATLAQETVVIFHDLELWFERRRDGLQAIQTLERLMDDFSDRILFVFNTNPHSFALINSLEPMHKRFIRIIQLTPFSTEEIKSLILSRHNSSGLHYRWNGKEERKLSELKKAKLFDAYFSFSEGNPGVVLNTWLSNIQRVSGGILDIRIPETPGLSVLRSLDDDWLVLLTHFALHKRLSAARLERITGLGESEADKMLHQMHHSGLIEEQGRGIFAINRYLEPLLIKVLSEKQLL